MQQNFQMQGSVVLQQEFPVCFPDNGKADQQGLLASPEQESTAWKSYYLLPSP